MRTLTKTGIRMLSAKYRSILIKCAIINASMFVGVFGAGSAMAEGVNTWSGLKNEVEGSATTINVEDNITRIPSDGDITISRKLSIVGTDVGTETGKYLSGDNTYQGLTVDTDGILTLTNITMKNFKKESGSNVYGGAVNNLGTITSITGNFTNNHATTTTGVDDNAYGGAIYNTGTIGNADGTGGIKGNFNNNTATNGGGAIYNETNSTTTVNIIGDFISNKAININGSSKANGGAIYNKKGIIGSITGNFSRNQVDTTGPDSDNRGGAIYNADTIGTIAGKFTDNTATKYGGAIYNTGAITSIEGVDDGTGNRIAFDNNSAEENGGAIFNDTNSTTAMNIIGDFISNSAKAGGAIYNKKGIIDSIEDDFESNSATSSNGGAIYNTDTIRTITGNFISNKANNNGGGGAIYNAGKITSISGNFTKNSAKTAGGALYNGTKTSTINFVAENNDMTFDGNYVTAETGLGGAIYNFGTVGLYANDGKTITFTGGDETTGKYDIDGIYNDSRAGNGILNINGYIPDRETTPVTYAGTVNLQNVDGTGTTNIYGGTVNVKDTFIQNDLNLNAGTLSLGKGGTVTNLKANGGDLSMSIPYGTFDNYTNEISTLTVDNFTGTLNNFTVDYDASSGMDNISVGAGSSGTIRLTAVNILSNAEPSPNDVFYLTGDGKGSITTTETGSITSAIDGYTYTFTFDGAGKGNVLVSMNADEQMSLPRAIQTESVDSYSAQLNPVIVYEDLGELAGANRNFTIFGNGSTIDGNGYAGITVTKGQTLTLNNADMKNFTDGAITNYGTTNIISQNTGSLTFLNNAGFSGGVIVSMLEDESSPSPLLHIEAQGDNINFTKNSSGTLGGGLVSMGWIDIIADKGQVVFDGNTALMGGGIVIQSSTELDKLNLVALNNDIVFKNNTAEGVIPEFLLGYVPVNGAGAMLIQSGQADIIAKNGKVVFQDNSTTGFGGAILGLDYGGDVLNKINIVAENNDIIFSGNTADFGGGAIANIGELNIKAKSGHTVEFATTTDSIANVSALGKYSTLTINDADAGYTGDVILQDVVSADLDGLDNTATPGDLVIGGGRVFAEGTIQQNDITVKKAILTLSKKTVAASETTPLAASVFTLDNSTLNLQNDSTGILNVDTLNLAGNNNLMLDADLAGEKIDQLKVTNVSGDGNIVISDIKLLSDATEDVITMKLFTDDTTTDVYNKVSGNLNGLKYSTIYKYDALYNPETGMVGFTRYNSGTSDDFNPYLYAPSGVANTTANITTQIATLAMDKMDDIVQTQGRSGGDGTTSSNVWVKVMGLNDNVEFNNFENIDSKALTVAAGYNTNKITCGDCDIVLGAYAGYIGGKQQYTDNDIDQNGGYIGLSSALTLGNAFATATVNGGLLNNKANNMYGTDRFNTRWLGAGLKTGYNYAITNSVILQPNLYGGYTLVNTQDYTSVSGIRLTTNNLNFFEIDPGLKLSAIIADGWMGSIQGKYAIVTGNGGDIKANDIALQNISTKNYIEYGIGINKSLTDAFYLGAKINRHDGGRTGWNGSIEFKYKF